MTEASLITVRGLQTALRSLGYRITPDGDFGLATIGAVKSFQMASGIAADGVPWPQTIAALRNALAASSASGQ
jgi:peptidoglycan hydrolase-like protein with peptidoglycan-binding domain